MKNNKGYKTIQFVIPRKEYDAIKEIARRNEMSWRELLQAIVQGKEIF